MKKNYSEYSEMHAGELAALFNNFDYSELSIISDMIEATSAFNDQVELEKEVCDFVLDKKLDAEFASLNDEEYSLRDSIESLKEKCKSLPDKELKFLGTLASDAAYNQAKIREIQEIFEEDYDLDEELEDSLPYGYSYGEEGIESDRIINVGYEMDSFLSRLCEDKGIVLSEDVIPAKPVKLVKTTKPTANKGKTKKLTLDNNKDKDK